MRKRYREVLLTKKLFDSGADLGESNATMCVENPYAPVLTRQMIGTKVRLAISKNKAT